MSKSAPTFAPIASAFVVLLAAPALSHAQASAPFSAETLWQLKRVGDPSISPDGKLAVVAVTRYEVDKNKGFTDLWLLPTAGGAARQLTSDQANDTSPRFSPDGKWIAFVSKRGDDKESQVYVIAPDGGEARRVTSVPTGAASPKWFPDSQRIAFISYVWPELQSWKQMEDRMKERADSKMTAKVWDKAPFSYWDRFIDDRQAHLYSIAASGSGDPDPITLPTGFALPVADPDTGSYDISPDGTEIAFSGDVDRSGIDSNFDIFVVPAEGGATRNLTTENPADDGGPLYSPDGRHLAFQRQKIKGFYGDKSRLVLLDRRSGTQRVVTEDWDRSAEGLVWSADSRALYGSIDDAGTRRIYRIEASGVTKALTKASSYSGLSLAGQTCVAIRQAFSEPPTLVNLNLRSGAATKLSAFNDEKLAGVKFGRVESVTYKGAADKDIQMWVVYPPDFDPAKKYPVYMLLHGGPHGGVTDSTQWRWNAQVFAAWGYITTWHNFHGSSGFGQDFTDSINPDWITLPYEDTIKAAEYLKSRPYVDAGRMAAGGGSYGGFLASTILGRPHPFKTLVAHAAVYNMFTQYAADFAARKRRFFNFWDKPADFARYSPHTAAANFVTPTLVIHGQLDMRVPVNHAFELFNTLQNRGVPSKFVYFPDENHWVLKPQNSLFWYQTKKEWLEKYIGTGARSAAAAGGEE